MRSKRFQLSTFLGDENEVFHMARTSIRSKYDVPLHRHGYVEVFWVKSGSGIHLINGEEVYITQGSLCMVRADDLHTFKLRRPHDQLVITSIAFDLESLQMFRDRYFRDSRSYFWTDSKLPFCIGLERDHLNMLSTLVDRMMTQPRDYIHLDSLMITIFRRISTIETEQLYIPHWLAYAMENYNSPDEFKKGVQGFVALTNCSKDYVNRTLQKHLKQTLTETVIKRRLEFASHHLIQTNSSIKAICFDSGFTSVSYFHRLFKKYMGLTPVEYRSRNYHSA